MNAATDFPVCRESEILDRYRVEMIDASSIFPSPENDTIYGEINLDNDPAMPALMDSIKRLGLEEPIICTRDKYILSGHRRFYACRELGWTRVPVRFANVSREGSPDYHRQLAQYNPQRVKSVAALLSEKFLVSDDYKDGRSFLERKYEKSRVDAEFITVDGTKGVDPIGRRTDFLKAAQRVVDDLKSFWPLTIRQIHYKLLNFPPLTQTTKVPNERWRYKNDDESYDKLSKLLVSARYLGHVPIHAIDDPTRISKEFYAYKSISEFVSDETDDFLQGYQRHRLEGQPNHVELLLEKNTLLNIVKPVADAFMLPYSVNRGYGNPSLWQKMQNRWDDSGKSRFILLSVTDHDPEGFDLVDDAVKSLRDLHETPVDLVRVALTQDQIAEQNATPNFAKETSSRFASYVDRTGSNECWEVESLDPNYLQAEVRKAVLSVLDVEQLQAVEARQTEEKQQIHKIRKRLGSRLSSILAEEGAL